jgi:hypothetical protein
VREPAIPVRHVTPRHDADARTRTPDDQLNGSCGIDDAIGGFGDNTRTISLADHPADNGPPEVLRRAHGRPWRRQLILRGLSHHRKRR